MAKAKKIVLFYMSRLSGATLLEETRSNGPEGWRFDRAQTNEAALRSICQGEDKPDLLLALCSDTVKTASCAATKAGEPVELDGSTLTTLEYFKRFVLPHPQVQLREEQLCCIDVPDELDDAARTEAIQAVLERLPPAAQGEPAELYLDISGGPRDIAMLLIALARYLQGIRGIQTRRVLYTGSPDAPAKESFSLYRLFDLISAADQFFATGSVAQLKAYMKPLCEKDDAARGLLDAIERFSEHLSLCRMSLLQGDLQKIHERLNAGGTARKAQTTDSLLYGLLSERFQQEFAPLMEGRYLAALAQWCVDHGLYQQALTLLCEEMPREVADSLHLRPKSEAIRDKLESSGDDNKKYNWLYALFHRFFAHLEYVRTDRLGKTETAYLPRIWDKENTKGGKTTCLVATLAEMERYMTCVKGMLQFDPAHENDLKQCILSYQNVLRFRNLINHAGDPTDGEKVEVKKLHEELQKAIDRLCALPQREKKLPPIQNAERYPNLNPEKAELLANQMLWGVRKYGEIPLETLLNAMYTELGRDAVPSKNDIGLDKISEFFVLYPDVFCFEKSTRRVRLI